MVSDRRAQALDQREPESGRLVLELDQLALA
jgi:hypothetical protein